MPPPSPPPNPRPGAAHLGHGGRVLLAAVVFGILFGPMGVLFATPLMVVTTVLVERLYVQWTLARWPAEARPRLRHWGGAAAGLH